MQVTSTDRRDDMTNHDINTLVAQGITAYNAGDRDRARSLLTQALQANATHEAEWLWMSAVVNDPAERKYCLERVLEVNPQHEAAQRGLAKFPPDVVSRSPLPAPPASATLGLCTYPGCTKSVSRAGHSLCYEHWKQTRNQRTVPGHAPAGALITASQIGEQYRLPYHRVNLLLAELGWIERQGQNWLVTSQGQVLGAAQRYYPDTGRSYVVWPERILEHKALRTAMHNPHGEMNETSAAVDAEQTFRKRFTATHRTTDGHLVRSKAEMLIDNWLYMSGVVHAYERQLPIEEEVYCDFYLPAGKVYIEYWGIENDPAYNTRRKTKVEIYHRYNLNLIELTDEHILNLDDWLPKILLRYKITVD